MKTFWLTVSLPLWASLAGATTAPAPTLTYRTGNITLLGGKATVRTGQALRYLGAEGARTVLVDLWGNPPEAASDVLGMIVPASVAPDAPNSWGVVITQSEDGHVTDDDARGIDYDELLRNMQRETRDRNAGREAAGYGSAELVGWADTPRYDGEAHKLYWAKELAFREKGGAEVGEHTLNYAVRVLGRDRVLELNAVAGMSQLGQVKADMGDVLRQVSFNPGSRYEDFQPGTDRVAGYGVAALIGGVAAKKVGLLGLAAVFLKKAWVLVLAAFGTLGRLLRRGRSGA
ncbi:DUF2167 domain-containing protein [Deinococcus aetherius]|nr:DUF2167 domain-containing protein [Deinococcus aetherius]